MYQPTNTIHPFQSSGAGTAASVGGEEGLTVSAFNGKPAMDTAKTATSQFKILIERQASYGPKMQVANQGDGDDDPVKWGST